MKKTSEKTKNGQSSDTCNIGQKTYNGQAKQKHRKTKKDEQQGARER